VQRNFLLMHAYNYRLIVQNAWPGLSRLIAVGKTRRGDDERLLSALRALEEAKPDMAAAIDGEEKRLELQSRASGAVEAEAFRADYRRLFLAGSASVFAERRAKLVSAAEHNLPRAATLEPFIDPDARAVSRAVGKASLPDAYAVCLDDPRTAGRCWAEVDDLFMMDYAAPIVYQHVADAALAVLVTAAAARVYKDRMGRAPESLASLVPGFLAAPPRDPFNAFKPLSFAVQDGSWRVYSVGPGRVDDGGKRPFDMTKEFSYRSWRDLPKGELLLAAH
jgi:hypothetical protein